jgi:hypothetical protein
MLLIPKVKKNEFCEARISFRFDALMAVNNLIPAYFWYKP